MTANQRRVDRLFIILGILALTLWGTALAAFGQDLPVRPIRPLPIGEFDDAADPGSPPDFQPWQITHQPHGRIIYDPVNEVARGTAGFGYGPAFGWLGADVSNSDEGHDLAHVGIALSTMLATGKRPSAGLAARATFVASMPFDKPDQIRGETTISLALAGWINEDGSHLWFGIVTPLKYTSGPWAIRFGEIDWRQAMDRADTGQGVVFVRADTRIEYQWLNGADFGLFHVGVGFEFVLGVGLSLSAVGTWDVPGSGKLYSDHLYATPGVLAVIEWRG